MLHDESVAEPTPWVSETWNRPPTSSTNAAAVAPSAFAPSRTMTAATSAGVRAAASDPASAWS